MAEQEAAPQAEPQDWDGKALAEWMSTSHGRRLMERFLDHCGAGQRLYQFDADQLGLAWRDGLADAGRFFEALLTHHCPDLWLRMIRERRTRIEREQARIATKEAKREPAREAPLTQTAIEQQADEQRTAAEAEEAERTRKAEADKRKAARKTKD